MASQLSTPPAKPSPPAPAPLPIAPLPVAKAVEPAASKPTTGTLWYVQIGSFADTGNAQTTLSLLQNIGYHGESSKIVSGTGATLYRVRLGPFPTETVARQAFDKVSRQGYPQARVLSETQPK
jgi:cell division protein FtsN